MLYMYMGACSQQSCDCIKQHNFAMPAKLAFVALYKDLAKTPDALKPKEGNFSAGISWISLLRSVHCVAPSLNTSLDQVSARSIADNTIKFLQDFQV